LIKQKVERNNEGKEEKKLEGRGIIFKRKLDFIFKILVNVKSLKIFYLTGFVF
jgi:hypothetical protein